MSLSYSLILLSLLPWLSNSYCIGLDFLTFDAAEVYCQEVSSHLASFGNSTDFDQILHICSATGSTRCWIGLRLTDTSRLIYNFSDGSPLQYGFFPNNTPTIGQGPWGDQQPSTINFPDDPQTCIVLSKSSSWPYEYILDDIECNTTYVRPICNNGTFQICFICAV